MPTNKIPMSDSALFNFKRLRRQAEQELATRPAESSQSSHPSLSAPLSSDVLELLLRLSSSATAINDALKLLHEFQVHQVELDMQYQQLITNELEMSREIDHYFALFNDAPIGNLVLSPQGQIIQGNTLAAEWLEVDQFELYARAFDNFIAPDDKMKYKRLLLELDEGAPRAHCTVQLSHHGKPLLRVQLSATWSRDHARIQMVLAELK